MQERRLILGWKLQTIGAYHLWKRFDFIQHPSWQSIINLNKCNRLAANITAPQMKGCDIQAMPAA
jgi:hypothetical protein